MLKVRIISFLQKEAMIICILGMYIRPGRIKVVKQVVLYKAKAIRSDTLLSKYLHKQLTKYLLKN